MRFSLITATLGGVEEVRCLCVSLSKQTFKDFELYIVDQNEHHELEDIVRNFEKNFIIHYIRSDVKGLSYNRNIALRMCKGEIIGFPDDDCYYEVNVLQEVNEAFSSREEVGFCAVTTRDTVTKRVCHISQKAYLYKKDVLKACISYNIFVRKNTVMFDERLGVGTYFSSGEETDYLYSFIENYRTCGFFVDRTAVYHPANNADISKVYKYSLGFAALQKKDWIMRRNYKALFVYLYYLLRAFCGMLLIRNFIKHWYSFGGKIIGFVKFKV